MKRKHKKVLKLVLAELWRLRDEASDEGLRLARRVSADSTRESYFDLRPQMDSADRKVGEIDLAITAVERVFSGLGA